MTGFRDFVAYHFTLSSRRDTEYWKANGEYIQMDPRMEDPKYSEVLQSLPAVMAQNLLQSHHLSGGIETSGVPDIFVGNRTIPANTTQLTILNNLVVSRQGKAPEIYTKQLQDYWDQKKAYIQELANDAPSHYQYLKENIYNGKD